MRSIKLDGGVVCRSEGGGEVRMEGGLFRMIVCDFDSGVYLFFAARVESVVNDAMCFLETGVFVLYFISVS